MKMTSLIAVVLLLGGCASIPPAPADPWSFDAFGHAIHTAILGKQETIVYGGKRFYKGSDYAIREAKVQSGIYIQYDFHETPCISPDKVRATFEKLGYVTAAKGLPSDHGDPRGQDAFSLSIGDETVSISVGYPQAMNYQCMTFMSISPFRKSRPRIHPSPAP
ncbi:MAG: hypothetical protein Q4G62_01385 [Pseudomonadota bacterium]|nr:hypothetical protein [Pseudomonadota bacterium]